MITTVSHQLIVGSEASPAASKRAPEKKLLAFASTLAGRKFIHERHDIEEPRTRNSWGER